MRRARGLAFAVSGLVAVLTCVAATAATASPDGALDRARAVTARYEAHVRADRPDLASRIGFDRCDDRLLPVTPSSLARDRAFLYTMAESILVLQRTALSAAARVEVDRLAGRVIDETGAIRSEAWRRSSSPYLEMVRDAVMMAAKRPRVSPCERERRVLRRLRAVPEVLRAAEVNLASPIAADPDSEAAGWAALESDWRGTLPGLFAGCHDADRYADLVQADSLALASARRFASVLRLRPHEAPSR